MNSILKLIIVIGVAHLFAVAGFFGWLVATGRVDSDRLTRVREMFVKPIAVEAKERAARAQVRPPVRVGRRGRLRRPSAECNRLLHAQRNGRGRAVHAADRAGRATHAPLHDGAQTHSAIPSMRLAPVGHRSRSPSIHA